MSARLGLLQVCAAGFLWGTGGVVVTLLNERDGIGAMTASAWRMLIAALALIAVTMVTRRLGALRAIARTCGLRAALTGIGTATYQALYFVAVLSVGVGVATVVALGLAPLLAAAWEHSVARTRPDLRQAVVLTTALVGLVLIATTGHRATTDAATALDPRLGLALAALAGAVYAATTVLGHSLAAHTTDETTETVAIDPIALTTLSTTAGAVVLLPFLGLAAATDAPVVPGDGTSLALIGYLGVATLALAYVLLYAGLRTTSGSAATLATLVEPISAALLAAAILDERLTATAWIGGALILIAVASLRPPPHPDDVRSTPSMRE